MDGHIIVLEYNHFSCLSGRQLLATAIFGRCAGSDGQVPFESCCIRVPEARTLIVRTIRQEDLALYRSLLDGVGDRVLDVAAASCLAWRRPV